MKTSIIKYRLDSSYSSSALSVPHSGWQSLLGLLLAVPFLIAPAAAATTDLASTPMVTSNSASVLPNLMFVLDDSGSMDWDYMPDTASNFSGRYGYSSSQCNGVYYDPNVTYDPPVDAAGNTYPNASFTAAWKDGYKTSSGTVNLSNNFRVDTNLSSQAAFYYVYTGTETTEQKRNYYNTSSTFYTECRASVPGSMAGNSKFTYKKVTSNSGPGGVDERTNFANWYSYYRTRMLMMKTAAGRAFKPIGNNYRIGYMSLNNNTGSDYLNITTFDASQKSAWYAKLYAARPNGGTPLREALSKAGKLYAGKLSSINGQAAADPVQYSCQQNFTLLSTDGFWNGAAGSKLDGSSVGNQDGNAARPMNDGGTAVYSRSTRQEKQEKRQISKSTSQVQKRTEQLKTRTSRLQRRTKSGSRWGNWSNVTSCTENASTQCQYANWSSWSNTSNCTPVSQSSASPYTVGTAVECDTTDSGWQGVTSCSPSSSGGARVTCQTNTTGPDPVASCTNANPTSGNSYTRTTCSTTTLQAATPVASCTAETASAANGYVATLCSTSTTGPTTVASCTPVAASSANNWTATTCTGSSSGGTSDTLADVAMYYYMTDLRSSALSNTTGALGNDVANNNVPVSGADAASWQHMTTFTLGLGARGRMVFDPAYRSASSGDFYSVKTGAIASSGAGICNWQSNGTVCNWPTPNGSGNGTAENIDDLWHAAVNGRGSYFSATNPTTLASSIAEALSGVSARTAASAAATTSNPNVTSGDNYVFESTFVTAEWHGQLERREIDIDTGVPLATTDWEARDQLDGNSARTIYTFSSASPNKLKSFHWASLTATERTYFSLSNLQALTQFCAAGPDCLSAADQTAAAGERVVDFLRGDRTHEGPLSDPGKYFRQRLHVLGDIVNAEAVYVRGSHYRYADAGYGGFATANASRQGMVYVAANDGMLHAFSGTTGAEAWAYVPAIVMPSLYKLVDKSYANRHQFFTDGTPVVGDVKIGGSWRTILVAGMNAGGRGYYALDVTNPAAPAALWEFTDSNLGYTYGNPVITKLADGTWVVIVTSGYNNINPGDGIGRLFILDASTGSLIRTIATSAGSTATPSGLSRIAAWAENANIDNTATRVYGGDLLGNVWRFDINDQSGLGAAGYDAQLLVTLKDAGGANQPVTAKPELGVCRGTPLVLVGTGRFLGISDLANTQTQSVYGIKDALGSSSTLSSPRVTGSGFVQQTMTTGTCPPGQAICLEGEAVRTASRHPVDYASKNGWYIDFPIAGERANVDPSLVLGTLTVNTNVPDSSACSIGGYSYINYFDYCSGGAVPTANDIISVKLGEALATRPVVLALPNKTLVSLTRLADGTTVVKKQPPPNISGTLRRVSWRELTND